MSLSLLRERCTLVLIAFLPFHAMVVTVVTRFLVGSSHAPLTILVLWKEVFFALLLFIVLLELSSAKRLNALWHVDRIDACILALLFLAATSLLFHFPSFHAFAYGLKYDFFALLLFYFFRRVPWSLRFRHSVLRLLLGVGFAVALYGLLSLVLPSQFFLWLGYTDHYSLYEPAQALTSFQFVHDTTLRRLQSVMSGPNQAGLWLIVPWTTLLVCLFWRKASRVSSRSALTLFFLFSLFAVALFFTFSRTAWLVAIAVGCTLVCPLTRVKYRWRTCMVFAVIFVVLSLCIGFLYPNVIVRLSSTRGHLQYPLRAVALMVAHPFGLGLGTAGPASNALSDTCVLLREGDDPSWARTQPDLCVFVGEQQVQPLSHPCRCPLLVENWYLQIGVELGWLGLFLYCALTFFLLVRLKHLARLMGDEFSTITFLLFLALSLAGFLLHAWEDAAVAYTIWTLCAISVSSHSLRQSSVSALA